MCLCVCVCLYMNDESICSNKIHAEYVIYECFQFQFYSLHLFNYRQILRCFFFSSHNILANNLRYLTQVSVILSKISAVHQTPPSPTAAQCLNNLDSLLGHMKSSF